MAIANAPALTFAPMLVPQALSGYMGLAVWIICAVLVWSVIWKGIALWKSARHRQLVWFIVLLVVNTAGILEIIYLLFFQKKEGRRK